MQVKFKVSLAWVLRYSHTTIFLFHSLRMMPVLALKHWKYKYSTVGRSYIEAMNWPTILYIIYSMAPFITYLRKEHTADLQLGIQMSPFYHLITSLCHWVMTKKGISRICSWLGGICLNLSGVATWGNIPSDGAGRGGRAIDEEEKILAATAT